MPAIDRSFQIFAKPAGARCNLACTYCYYLDKVGLAGEPTPRMAPEVLEAYVAQHMAAATDPVISFSWHGGEPTVLGLEYFRAMVELQRRLCPQGRRVANGMQTNGTLLDEEWATFLADEGWAVGLSLDGPAELHDRYRTSRAGKGSHAEAIAAYRLLQRHGVHTEVLCVVSAANCGSAREVYEFFREIGARYITFLPLVERQADTTDRASDDSVPAAAWGEFLCEVFDLWKADDVGRVEVQIFEETLRAALGLEHSLCVLRPTCGDVPVVERDGSFYACDHFVDANHRQGSILESPLSDLLNGAAQRAFGQAKLESLPGYCRECEERSQCNGGCPKNRFSQTPDGEGGLNYLCEGYRRFFAHARPLADQAAALSQGQVEVGHAAVQGAVPAAPRAGRNDPCPCGSGRKHKRCCLGQS